MLGDTMKFRTIWTMPAMTFAERLRRTRDWAAITVAVMLPLRVRYWVTLSEIGRATMDSPAIMDTPLDDILNNLDKPKVVT